MQVTCSSICCLMMVEGQWFCVNLWLVNVWLCILVYINLCLFISEVNHKPQLSEYMLFLCTFYLSYCLHITLKPSTGRNVFFILLCLFNGSFSLFCVLQFFILMQNLVMGLQAKRPVFLHLAFPHSPQTFSAYHLFVPYFRLSAFLFLSLSSD